MVHIRKLRFGYFLPLLFCLLFLSSCNLTSAPEQQLALTDVPTNTPPPTRTLIPTGGAPTTLPITQIAVPTSQQVVIPPTSISLPPTFIPFPTSTPTPISIVILSPIPGNIVAGNVQVLGAATHPLFLQYQLEYGPDPNPGNLWYSATGIVQTPVYNGLLGIWNTTAIQDSTYQLRLRVILRDGTSLATVVNNIRIQNQAPTPVPSATPSIARPIAAFTQDRSSGQAPLVVRFLNQSSGNITNYYWTFGDGGSSTEANPTYTFRAPGVNTVTLTVSGPGGTSNVSQQINIQSPSAPVAAFTQDLTSGPSPLTVKFTNQSTGSITAYNWAFGDGTSSTEQNPTHQFVNVGTYNVILSVTGPGGTSFVTRKITVEDPVIPPPVAVFTPNQTQVNVSSPVQFSNQSTGQITGYVWDFGDGQTSIDKNPIHMFTNAGTFTVKLTAIGPGGQNATQTNIQVIAPPNAPTAAFTKNLDSGNVPLVVQFTNSSSGEITAYVWEFGDGETSNEKDPSHTYTNAGTYTVKLVVTGPGGVSETTSTITVTQPVAPPVAAFAADPVSGVVPLTIQLTNQSTGDSLSFVWDFGDSSPTSTEANPVHTYNNAGNYNIKLTASNTSGQSESLMAIMVSAAPVAPVASFVADTTSGTAPLSVNFSSTSSGDISAYAWSFTDSAGTLLGSSADANTSFTFANEGSYTAILTVSGPGGDNSSSQAITVSAAPVAPVASFVADTTSGTAPLSVNFSSTSSGDISAYAWSFTDSAGTLLGSSADANTSFTFANEGSYTAILTVSGPGGDNSSSQAITVSAAPVAPVASFVADTTSGTAPLSVNFSSTSSGDISAYAWSFTDSAGTLLGSSADANTSFTFANEGSYTAILTVSGPGGDNSSSQAITVSAAPVAPVASFVANTTSGTAPLSVNFSSTSSGDISAYAWSFTDSAGTLLGSSADANASFTFANEGSYTATLTVSGPGGDNSSSQVITVSGALVIETPPINSPLAFVSNQSGDVEIYLLNVDGSQINLTNNGATDAYPSWSPDGNRIAFVSNRDGNDEIYVMNSDGSNVSRLTNDPSTDTTPVWSADGSQIIFASNREGNYDLYSMNSGDGSNVVNLTNNPANDTSPAISPDGTRIAFMTDRDGGNNEIYVLSLADSSSINVTNSPSSVETSPSWSPNASQIIFVTDRDLIAQLYVMGADGSNPVRLSDLSNADTNPVWSRASSQQIAFISQRDGTAQIYVMNPDGSNVTRVNTGTGSATMPSWRP